MKQVLLVFVGGGIGSVLRYVIGKASSPLSVGFPWGTFSVNIIGSLSIGIFMGIALKNNYFSENQILLLVTGLCGGFTTFSTFGLDLYGLLQKGSWLPATSYFLANFFGTLIFIWLGFRTASF